MHFTIEVFLMRDLVNTKKPFVISLESLKSIQTTLTLTSTEAAVTIVLENLTWRSVTTV